MTKYYYGCHQQMEYIKHVINREPNLFAIRIHSNSNDDHLNVFMLTLSKNVLVCTVRTCGKQIAVEYDDEYVLADWKTKIRRYYSAKTMIDGIKEAIIKSLRGENNMGKIKVESVDYELNVGYLGSSSSDYTIKVSVDGFYPSLAVEIRRAIESLNNGKSAAYIYSRDDCNNTEKLITWRNEYEKERDKFEIKDVIFNNPATIVLWADGTKTVVKAENEPFDPEKGLAMAIAKKALGNNYDYYDVFKKYVGKYEKKQKKGGK